MSREGAAAGGAGAAIGTSDAAGSPRSGGAAGEARAAGASGPGRPAGALAAVLALGAIGSVLAWLAEARWQPLPAGDPLAGTLEILPVLLPAFHLIHRWGVRLGARRLSPRGSAGELAVLGIVAAAALARPALGLAHSAEVLAAGLLLVLIHRVARQVLALRPLLGSRLGPRRPPWIFFWLPLAAYLAILPWSAGQRQPDGDEPYNLLLAHSLAYDGDTDLANNYAAADWRHFMDHPIAPQPGDPVGRHGEVYSRHNALLPLVLALPYRLAGRTGAQAAMAVMAAALAWSTLRLARRYAAGYPGESLLAYAAVAFVPPLPFYSNQIWVEVPAGLLAILALDATHDLAGGLGGFGSGRRGGSSGVRVPGSANQEPATDAATRAGGPANATADPTAAPPLSFRTWAAVAAPVLLLPLLKIRFILIAAPLAAIAVWQTARQPRRRRAGLALGLALLALIGGILLYNQRQYANPLKIHSLGEIDPQQHTLLDYLGGGLGLFYDAAFGLFAYAPLWLLLLPALALLLKRRSALTAHLAVLTLPYLLVVTPRGEWYGGWSPPFRYAVFALPLLGLALAPLLAERRRPGARALIGGLGALTLALALVWLVVPGWTYNFADGRTYALDHLSARLGADVARFFPSAVRPRAATWIWPPASLALVAGIWWLPLRRGARGAAPAAGAPANAGTAALAGVVAILLATALLPLAGARMPTRVVELEDPQVLKLGGHLYPDRWVFDRTLYRGGWVLRVGDEVAAPIVPGGRRVRLALTAEFIRNQPVPFAVDVAAGGRLLAVWTPARERSWDEIRLGPFDWPAGMPLVLTAHGPHPPGALNGAILDRIDLAWQ